MTISTLSSKNQTTLGVELVKQLNLTPGVRLMQRLDGNRIIIEPLGDILTAFGSLKPRRKFRSIAEETDGMETAVAKEVAQDENAV